MQEIICVNDVFSSDMLQFYKKWNVAHPVREVIYSIRDVIINSTGQTGLLLIEIVNPKVPIIHPIMNENVMMEPNWWIGRFRTLQGKELDVIAIKQLFKHPELV